MTDILCKACGKKLYDAEKDLRYWFTDPQDHRTWYGCIHCGYAYTPTEKSKWSVACLSAPPDVPVFDAQAEARGICPPTVFRRFRLRVDELSNKDRSVLNAQELLDEVWAAWRAEQ